jgi:hypothetical protein
VALGGTVLASKLATKKSKDTNNSYEIK